MNLDRETLRHRKVARTLIRLKHSLDADEEIYRYLEEEKAALAKGVVTRLDASMKDLIGNS